MCGRCPKGRLANERSRCLHSMCGGLSQLSNIEPPERSSYGQNPVARKPYGTIARSVVAPVLSGVTSTFRFRFGRFSEHYCVSPREENHEETEQGGVVFCNRRCRNHDVRRIRADVAGAVGGQLGQRLRSALEEWHERIVLARWLLDPRDRRARLRWRSAAAPAAPAAGTAAAA